MVDRTEKARERSLEVRREAVRGRSGAVYAVLRTLSGAERPLSTSQVAQNAGLSIGNARRVLVGLVRKRQISREDVLQYEMIERPDGVPAPKRQQYSYQITPMGVGRMEWLKKNKPWEDNE
jgi:response regulator of citrate/malate metabolism